MLINVLIGDGVRVGERGRKVVGDEGEKKKRNVREVNIVVT